MVDEEYEVIKFLHSIPDPRIKRCRKYSLESILFLTLVGMLCGADNAHEIVEFGINFWTVISHINTPI